jgi:hypothetical protein
MVLKNNLTKRSQVAIRSSIYLFFNVFVHFAFRIAKAENSYNLQLSKTYTTEVQGNICQLCNNFCWFACENGRILVKPLLKFFMAFLMGSSPLYCVEKFYQLFEIELNLDYIKKNSVISSQ